MFKLTGYRYGLTYTDPFTYATLKQASAAAWRSLAQLGYDKIDVVDKATGEIVRTIDLQHRGV